MVASAPRLCKEMMPMVTYTDLFTFVTMICTVVTLIETIRRKK